MCTMRGVCSRRRLARLRTRKFSLSGASRAIRCEGTIRRAILISSSRLSWYKTIGIFIGRALIDSRIIDVTLNKVFLKLILGSPVRKNIATLRMVDPALARSLERLQAYASARREIEALQLVRQVCSSDLGCAAFLRMVLAHGQSPSFS